MVALNLILAATFVVVRPLCGRPCLPLTYANLDPLNSLMVNTAGLRVKAQTITETPTSQIRSTQDVVIRLTTHSMSLSHFVDTRSLECGSSRRSNDQPSTRDPQQVS